MLPRACHGSALNLMEPESQKLRGVCGTGTQVVSKQENLHQKHLAALAQTFI